MNGRERASSTRRTFTWTDAGWRRPATPAGAVFYELHIGTFTPEGTFDAAVEQLDHLVDLGVDVVEVMPVAAFPGPLGLGLRRRRPLRRARALRRPGGVSQRSSTPATRTGLAVCLDVVYNHLGPSGNYLARVRAVLHRQARHPVGRGGEPRRRRAPSRSAAGSSTTRCAGSATSTSTPCAWTPCTPCVDDSARARAGAAVRRGRGARRARWAGRCPWSPRVRPQRPAHGHPDGRGRPRDDRAVGRRRAPRPARLADRRTAGLLRRLRRAEVLATTLDARRSCTPSGSPPSAGSTGGSRSTAPRYRGTPFLGYLQTHDQVGNRAVGDRIGHLLSPSAQAAGAALYLLGPFTPMVFMGEEWDASTKWQFFTAFPDPDLGKAVSTGPPLGVRPARLGRRGRPRPAGPGHQGGARSCAGTRSTPSRTRGCWPGTGR